MIPKSFAGIMIILGCGYLGMTFSAKLDTRINQLKAIENVLTRLAFNIGFLAMPFAEALKRASEGSGRAGEVFSESAKAMAERPQISAEVAFDYAVKKCGYGICIGENETKAIREFMMSIGKGDKENAKDAVRLTGAKLKFAREEAEAERARDGKLYRGLGFLTGILIVILLI